MSNYAQFTVACGKLCFMLLVLFFRNAKTGAAVALASERRDAKIRHLVCKKLRFAFASFNFASRKLVTYENASSVWMTLEKACTCCVKMCKAGLQWYVLMVSGALLDVHRSCSSDWRSKALPVLCLAHGGTVSLLGYHVVARFEYTRLMRWPWVNKMLLSVLQLWLRKCCFVSSAPDPIFRLCVIGLILSDVGRRVS